MSDTPPTLSADAIRELAAQHRPDANCACATLRCAGWESLSATFDETTLQRVGRVSGADAYDEPTHQEYHPAGTRYASPDAPIALGHFPYNRCEIWQCVHCARAFLRYTEYGGYYVDQRIRDVNAARVIDTSSLPPKD